MHHRRPLVSTHADSEHLHETALVGTVKGGVRLYPIDRYQSISLCRFLANVDWQSGKWPFGLPELYHIRRTKNRGTDLLLGHPQTLQQITLPIGRTAPVTADRAEQERLVTLFLN